MIKPSRSAQSAMIAQSMNLGNETSFIEASQGEAAGVSGSQANRTL